MGNIDAMEDIFDLMGRMVKNPNSTPKQDWEYQEWDYQGMACIIAPGGYSCLCGYVVVPEGNPAYGKGIWDEILSDLDVHGGVTYSQYGRFNPEDWYVGFDTMHPGDDSNYWTESRVIEETEKLALQIKNLTRQIGK